MDKIKYRIILDAHKGGVQKVIRGFFTGDVASRTIAVNINASGLPCNLGVGTAAVMYVTKSNGVTNYGACEVIDNTVYYDVNQSDIDSPGIVEMQLKILNGESVLYAPLFALDVQESKVSDTEAETTPTFSVLEAALAKAQFVYDTRVVSIEITPEYVFVVKYADDSEYTNDCLSDVFARADEAIQGVNDALSDFEESRTELQGYVDVAFESMNVAESMAQSASGSADASRSFADDASEFATRAEQAAERAETVADLTIDTELSTSSTNPIANKAVAEAFENVDAKTIDGHEATEVGASGARNLVPYPYYEKAGTESGITWTVNDDGTIHVKGKATASVSFTLRATSENWFLPKGTYILSGCPSGGSFTTYRLQLARFINGTLTSYANEYGAGAVVDITDDLPLLLQFVIANNVEIDAIIKPMLENGSVAHEFVPYYLGGAEKAKTANNATNATHAITADTSTHSTTADDANTLGGYDSSSFVKANGGGTIAFDNYTDFKVKRNNDNDSAGVGITFCNNNGTLGMIVFKNKKMCRVDISTWGEHEVLDVSNSAKVHIGTTAPNDTTGNVLFINTSA